MYSRSKLVSPSSRELWDIVSKMHRDKLNDLVRDMIYRSEPFLSEEFPDLIKDHTKSKVNYADAEIGVRRDLNRIASESNHIKNNFSCIISECYHWCNMFEQGLISEGFTTKDIVLNAISKSANFHEAMWGYGVRALLPSELRMASAILRIAGFTRVQRMIKKERSWSWKRGEVIKDKSVEKIINRYLFTIKDYELCIN